MIDDVSDYRIEAIPADVLESVRAAGKDEAGNPLRVIENQPGDRSPLRCCLRSAQDNERIMLIAYTPPGLAGPYAERGPVFVHAEACDGFSGSAYPLDMTGSAQVVRGYDHDGNMAESTVVATAAEAERELAALVGQPHIRVVHVRNAAAGCFNFAAWPVK
jgi:hypothetical protein